jgi:hypothetical protein
MTRITAETPTLESEKIEPQMNADLRKQFDHGWHGFHGGC